MMIKNKKIFFILLLALLIRLFFLIFQYHDTWWDSAVYIGMGKYIFSNGSVGLWEPARPLIWPLFLGILWKLKLDVILFGRILLLFFSLGSIYLTYLIGKRIFNKKIALLAAALLSFTPTYLFYSTVLLSSIPSLFFGLLSVYFFI